MESTASINNNRKWAKANPSPEVVAIIYSHCYGSMKETKAMMGMSYSSIRRRLEEYDPSILKEASHDKKAAKKKLQEKFDELVKLLEKNIDIDKALDIVNQFIPTPPLDLDMAMRYTSSLRRKIMASTRYPGVTVLTERVVDLVIAGLSYSQTAKVLYLSGKSSVHYHCHHKNLPLRIKDELNRTLTQKNKVVHSSNRRSNNSESSFRTDGRLSESVVEPILLQIRRSFNDVELLSPDRAMLWDYLLHHNNLSPLKIQVRKVRKDGQISLKCGSNNSQRTYDESNCELLFACDEENNCRIKFFTHKEIDGKKSISFSKGKDVSSNNLNELIAVIDEIWYSKLLTRH